ncbi:bifunctional diguanylate cyclase/phosphodiesterase [Pleomorphomonas sp. JP5]|uniref:putative bifunctional diguanylate cyclase/phosphodiesterase n=1 Tax=Pleomorphomonas sp. JP5 TaxID=2942998 RepID=UPI0020448799|nr:EAL domain-containing protein [Pleomorphomonas sp. JP5]MCM5557083.1 EAL domain-containing protein [Pleomorphomonas sp. JP5]
MKEASRSSVSPLEFIILIIDGFLVLFIAVATLSAASRLSDAAIERQLKIQTNIADVMSDEINHAFQAMDLVLIGITDHLKAREVNDQVSLIAETTSQSAFETLRARMSGLAFLDALTITDETGRVLASTRRWPAPEAYFGDRPYFKAMQSMIGPPTYLSQPIIGRIAGRPNLVLSHRMTSDDGHFLGVVNAASDQGYFANRLARVDVGKGSLIAFILEDGTVLAQSPALVLDKASEANPPRHDAGALLALPAAGGLVPADILGDTERYAAIRRLPSYPAAIVISVAARTVNEEIRRTIFPLAIASLLVCAGILLVTGLWIRQLRRDRKQSALQYRQARTDVLTGLANRLYFVEWLEALDRTGSVSPYALYFADLDYFKTINDTLGHDVGDKLLAAVAERLVEHLGPTDRIARLGGDEFAIICMGVMDEINALRIAEIIVSAIRKPFQIEGHQLNISTSIGISLCPRDGHDLVTLLKCADLALFKAKADGRGLTRVFSEELASAMETRRELQADLEEAWKLGQFYLAYQPIYEAAGRRLAGFEALLRWKHPTRGMVPPDVFIPVAEETGLINRLGAWVLERACAEAMTWPAPLFVSINLSPVQFRAGAIEAQVHRALRLSGLPNERLELEITESTLLQKEGGVQAALGNLRASRINIALDDFGTGYSSLRYLIDFQIDRIKVDRYFVEGVADKSSSQAIIQAILALASTLGLQCTAEGIETEEQAEILGNGGCSHLQGYLLGRPVTPEQAQTLALATERRVEAG